jgi:mRNA-degrading endonuclease RelE of RelBE toxin-antitoxin system
MSKTIVFKPEFEKKLKKLKIKTKFVKNLKNPQWPHPDKTNYYKQEFENAPNWKMFIHYAFNWARTPEDHFYWERISNK